MSIALYFGAAAAAAAASRATPVETAVTLCNTHFIGCHRPKRSTLRETILGLGDVSKPYQIFLGSPQSSKLSLKDLDLAAGAAAIEETGARVYVHSPYMINLATDTSGEGAWAMELLRNNLKYAATLGCRGVVVHVGKSVKRPAKEALETMRTNLAAVLAEATPSCPLLLETPAGQGTELLTEMDEFIEFVRGFQNPCLKICLDTCHTFACGHDPLTYIKAIPTGLLHLVHFNDSQEGCGSRKDRHAFVGEGEIGLTKMEEIARYCTGLGVPMVIE